MKKSLILFSCLAILLTACGNRETNNGSDESVEPPFSSGNRTSLTAEQMENGEIVLGRPERREMRSILKVNGMVDVAPQNLLSVSFPLGGYIKNIRLLPGMKIKKGSVLCTLEDVQYIQLQQDYLSAKSSLQFLETDFLRQQELNTEKANSDKTFQQSRNLYESQKILVRSLSEKLRLININPDKLNENNISSSVNIISPIDGYVSRVNVNAGKYVAPADVLFELINPENVHLSLTIFEKDAARVSPGQRVIAYNAERPLEKRQAIIELITRNIDENRAVEAHCHFKKTEKQLTPGMFMSAEIELSNEQTLAVPNDALVRWENNHFVFANEGNNVFEMIPVDIGISDEGFTAVKTDIKEKEIVVRNAYALLMKMKNTD
ncbi:MAG TPA: efflux RND transporter periplasmic adaptor subunit [Flavitalea sp.]|nr:efflux RND transporter periplasmic adaptor subunit [Flavitalea sp.]